MSSIKNSKLFIDTVCAVVHSQLPSFIGDYTIIQLARQIEMSPNGRAREYLDHYLYGGGTTKIVPLHLLLKDDRKIASFVAGELKNKLTQLVKCGTIPLPQYRFSNKDWQFAIGSINLNWELLTKTKRAASFRLGFRNEYRWYPKEPRITQCVHKAADDLKIVGAKDYWMEGKALVEVDLREISKFNKIEPTR